MEILLYVLVGMATSTGILGLLFLSDFISNTIKKRDANKRRKK